MHTRRSFLAASAVAVSGPLIRSYAADEQKEKVRVALIGVAGQGKFSLDNIAGETVAALCDVDPSRAEEARKRFPDAKFFTDYCSTSRSCSTPWPSAPRTTPTRTRR